MIPPDDPGATESLLSLHNNRSISAVAEAERLCDSLFLLSARTIPTDDPSATLAPYVVVMSAVAEAACFFLLSAFPPDDPDAIESESISRRSNVSIRINLSLH